jgi:hypothetical protein
MTLVLEQYGQQPPAGGVVIDDQDVRHLRAMRW